MADIVTLTGKPDVRGEHHEVDERVVEAIEILLQDAKAGRLIGVRAVCLGPDQIAHGMTVGYASHSMLGMLYRLTSGLANEMEEQEE